jgi:hypothetical protein
LSTSRTVSKPDAAKRGDNTSVRQIGPDHSGIAAEIHPELRSDYCGEFDAGARHLGDEK